MGKTLQIILYEFYGIEGYRNCTSVMNDTNRSYVVQTLFLTYVTPQHVLRDICIRIEFGTKTFDSTQVNGKNLKIANYIC